MSDNEPIGPIANGRDLLDYAAKYLVSVARRRGKVGIQFGIRDIFDCVAMTCPNVDSKLEIAWQNIKFTCQYFGSEGTTSSAFSVRNLIRAR